jgi:hypothetical protein
MDEMWNTYRVSVGKPEGMRPVGRLIYRLVNNIKIDLKVTGLGGMD